jgi:hypothetical protein
MAISTLYTSVSSMPLLRRFKRGVVKLSEVARPEPTTAKRQEAEHLMRGLFLGMLRRAPAASELEHFVGAILLGRTPASIVDEFLECEEFRAATRVKLFVPPGHFYSPVVDPAEAARHFAELEAAPLPDSVADVRLDRSEIVQTWRALLPYLTTVPFSGAGGPPFRYRFDNPAYSWADGSLLHAMLRHYRPSQVIEIGSGWSSACTVDTVEHYLDGACRLTFIEPYPELLHTLLGETKTPVRIMEQPVQHVPLDVFTSLQANDILFIDSTHVLRTGSDVCYELFEILPLLARGVIVHIHDMFWPFEYKRSWAVDENRSWNELYAVRALLANSDRWKIIMFNDWIFRFERDLIADTYPPFLNNTGGALWLQRT